MSSYRWYTAGICMEYKPTKPCSIEISPIYDPEMRFLLKYLLEYGFRPIHSAKQFVNAEFLHILPRFTVLKWLYWRTQMIITSLILLIRGVIHLKDTYTLYKYYILYVYIWYSLRSGALTLMRYLDDSRYDEKNYGWHPQTICNHLIVIYIWNAYYILRGMNCHHCVSPRRLAKQKTSH